MNESAEKCSVVFTSIKLSISGFSQSGELKSSILSCVDECCPSAVSEIDLLGGCGGGGGGGGEGHPTGIFREDRRQILIVFLRVWFTLVDVLGVVMAGIASSEPSLSFLRDLYAAEMASGSLPQCLSSTRAFWQNALSSNNPLPTASLMTSASLMNCFSAIQRLSMLCRTAAGGCRIRHTHTV